MFTNIEFARNTNTSRVPEDLRYEDCDTDMGDCRMETPVQAPLCHTKLNKQAVLISPTRRFALGFSVLTQANAHIACAAACAELVTQQDTEIMKDEDDIYSPVSPFPDRCSHQASPELTPMHRPKRIRAEPKRVSAYGVNHGEHRFNSASFSSSSIEMAIEQTRTSSKSAFGHFIPSL